MTGEEIYKAAIHEAGHAVASIRLFEGKFPGKISLKLENDFLESHASEKLFFYSGMEEKDSELKKKAIYACAGYAAMILMGHDQDEGVKGCTQDFEMAVNLTWTPIDELKKESVSFMNKPENIIAFRLIADELMQKRRLDYDVISTLVAAADILFVTSVHSHEQEEYQKA